MCKQQLAEGTFSFNNNDTHVQFGYSRKNMQLLNIKTVSSDQQFDLQVLLFGLGAGIMIMK